MRRVFLFLLLFAVAGCGQKMCPKTYNVRHLANARINIDGVLDEADWQKASLETGFVLSWEDRPAPLTEFRAFYDEEYFYFSFNVQDDDIVAEEKFGTESVVDREDRVEIFFARSSKLEKYFCLEVDPRGRVHSYSASYHRKLDSSWDCAGLRAAASITEQGYAVEGAIALKTFESLGLPVPGRERMLTAGLFRADFAHGSDGELEKHWISWVDLSKEKPDFHVHAAFGCMRMDK